MALNSGSNDQQVDGGVATDGQYSNSLNGVALEPPIKPEWTAGKPGFFTRILMKVAGVDMNLARTVPADEQLHMKRVGLALIFGAAFLFVMFGMSLATSFGLEPWTIPVVLVLSGIMWAFDTKFVGAHWAMQGMAFCRAHGLMPPETWARWGTRAVAPLATRITFSAFIAFAITDFVMLKLFEPDIIRQFQRENRVQNQPTVDAVTQRHESVVADSENQIAESDQKIGMLTREREQILGVGGISTADIDTQIANHLDRIKKLEGARDAEMQTKASQRQDVIAEKHGVRINEGNTGRAGKGSYYNFHNEMAGESEASIKSLATEIESESTAIARLRRERATLTTETVVALQARLADLENRISQETARRAALTVEHRKLQDGREEWIALHVRATPGYVPMPEGILAKLQALAVIIAGSPLIASLVFSTRILIMLLESAGPLAKVVFTAPGIYQMLVALRLHDTVEFEADRRIGWRHWRLRARGHHQQAIDVLNADEQRRATEARARDALHKIMQKVPWMH